MTIARTRIRLTARDLRSWKWFGPDDLRSFGHRSRIKQMGFSREDYEGKPVIAILNTWSDLNTCHTHFKQRAEQVKRGVWQAGGFPVELPVMSLSESYMKPTSMFYRNLTAMEVEETLRCHPIDGAVLMGGCDKTVPALMMGAASANLPAIFLPAGPMLKGNFAGKTLGSGTDAWKYWAERCAGNLCDDDWLAIEDGIARSPGTCMTMGTASTMAAIAETLGLTLSGASSIPAVHSAHERLATACGKRAVELVWEDLRPSDILTADAFDNAITIDMALSGSTNAIIHLIAMAGRAGVKLDLDLFDAISRRTPVLANLRPAGKYLMEDFHDAGGLPAMLWRIRDLLKLGCLTVSGKTLGENIKDAPVHNEEVILPREKPLSTLRRHLRPARQPRPPNGAVIKPTAAEPRLLEAYRQGGGVPRLPAHEAAPRRSGSRGHRRFGAGAAERRAGGRPGHAGMGHAADPDQAAQAGRPRHGAHHRCAHERHQLRLLRAACQPGIGQGGPLALVQDGDLIELDVAARRLHLHISDEELARGGLRHGAAACQALHARLRPAAGGAHHPGPPGLRFRFPAFPPDADTGSADPLGWIPKWGAGTSRIALFRLGDLHVGETVDQEGRRPADLGIELLPFINERPIDRACPGRVRLHVRGLPCSDQFATWDTRLLERWSRPGLCRRRGIGERGL
jgi:dihydroxyacid dehydratase/phosphogluconate dehydratase